MKQNFSQRNGFGEASKPMQIESLDGETRSGLLNAVFDNYLETAKADGSYQFILKLVWKNFFRRPINEMPIIDHSLFRSNQTTFLEILIDFINNAEWNKVLDFLEFLIFGSKFNPDSFIEECNEVFTRENSVYRIVRGSVVSLTSEIEIEEINTAFGNIKISGNVKRHLDTALKALSDRNQESYRIVVSESVSAVESLCKEMIGTTKGTLSDALKVIKKDLGLHSALHDAFQKMYAYAGDESGIRHSLKEDGNDVTEVDARFFLVSCTAFINYLNGKIIQ